MPNVTGTERCSDRSTSAPAAGEKERTELTTKCACECESKSKAMPSSKNADGPKRERGTKRCFLWPKTAADVQVRMQIFECFSRFARKSFANEECAPFPFLCFSLPPSRIHSVDCMQAISIDYHWSRRRTKSGRRRSIESPLPFDFAFDEMRVSPSPVRGCIRSPAKDNQ